MNRDRGARNGAPSDLARPDKTRLQWSLVRAVARSKLAQGERRPA